MDIALIDERDYRHAMGSTVLPALDACMHDGTLEPAHEDHLGRPLYRIGPLGRLHYVIYDHDEFQRLQVPGASREDHGTVVISHGFSEFAAKYTEMAWYFLLAGFSVCILEHRGHGYSPRDVADPDIVHIDDWRRYVADYATFVREVGRPQAAGRPLALFAHSMGGGIAAAMLERYPNLVDRAVLSSPMIAPNTGAVNWLAATVCGAACDLGHGKEMAPGQHHFDPVIDWSRHEGASTARVAWAQELRVANTHYRTSGASNEWVRQAVRLSRAILKVGECARIEVPIRLFQAEHDHWVRNGAQDAFVELAGRDGGHVDKVRVPGALHELFAMPNATMAPYVRQTIEFLQDSEPVNVLP